jgi:quinol monooxygenase YgiN
MIHVIATVRAKPDMRDALLEHFHRLVPQVRAEQGCLEYGPAVDLPTDLPAQGPVDGDVMIVLERWESLEALKAHLVAPHMLSYRQAVADLVDGVSLKILQPA